MSSTRSSWLWPVALMVSVVTLSAAFTISSVYHASGDSHDTTYYACLYAGSLSQVGTTEPANCGRGQQISWSSTGVEGLPGEPASMFWAYVNAEGEIVRGSGVIDVFVSQPGYWWVQFEQDVSHCSYSASATWEGEIVFEPVMLGVSSIVFQPDTVGVALYDSEGDLNDVNGFHVQVFCTEPGNSNPL